MKYYFIVYEIRGQLNNKTQNELIEASPLLWQIEHPEWVLINWIELSEIDYKFYVDEFIKVSVARD